MTSADVLVGELAARAVGLARGRSRAVLGICGAPGAGKSWLADRLVAALGADAVLVPMDGFHLQDDELRELGRLDRKGAPDTFDVEAYVALLRQVREHPEDTVHAPAFDRDRELSVPGAIAVEPHHRIVVTEGNYLLEDAPGWAEVRPLLDECWFVVADDEARRRRLVDRHVRHGRSRDEATEWVLRNDEANARLVLGTRDRADLVVDPRTSPAWMAP